MPEPNYDTFKRLANALRTLGLVERMNVVGEEWGPEGDDWVGVTWEAPNWQDPSDFPRWNVRVKDDAMAEQVIGFAEKKGWKLAGAIKWTENAVGGSLFFDWAMRT